MNFFKAVEVLQQTSKAKVIFKKTTLETIKRHFENKEFVLVDAETAYNVHGFDTEVPLTVCGNFYYEDGYIHGLYPDLTCFKVNVTTWAWEDC